MVKAQFVMLTFNTGSGMDWGMGTEVGMGMVFTVAPLDCTGGGSTDLRETLARLAALNINFVKLCSINLVLNFSGLPRRFRDRRFIPTPPSLGKN